MYDHLEALALALPPDRQQALARHLDATVSITDDLRQAIESSGLSLYVIARDTGVDPAVLGRFVRGERDLRLATAEKLVGYFNMRLTKPRKPSV